jgi:hypothetical protein
MITSVLLFAAIAASNEPRSQHQKKLGMVCIAPFQVSKDQYLESPRSLHTWAPGEKSKFSFSVDGKVRAEVGAGESACMKDLETQKPIRISVKLDGKPYESFKLDLAQEGQSRVCLWLYPNYWHWINNGWERCAAKKS